MTMELPLFTQGGTYSARLLRQLLANMYDEGILGPSSFAVTQRGAGANFSVDIAAGIAVVTGDDETDQGNYLTISTATENVAVSAAPGSNSRYDIVVVQVNDPTAGGATGDDFTVAVIAGSVSATPSPPPVPDSALLLATIGPITPATASITNAIIADDREAAVLTHDVIGPDSVDTAAIEDEAVTAAKLAPTALDMTWTNLAYGTNWGAPDTSFQRMQYAKFGNTVFVWGGMKYSGTTGVTTLGTLPAGFRPPAGFSLSAFGVDDGDRCEIQSDGDIVALVTSGRNVFINVHFPAA